MHFSHIWEERKSSTGGQVAGAKIPSSKIYKRHLHDTKLQNTRVFKKLPIGHSEEVFGLNDNLIILEKSHLLSSLVLSL